MDALHPAPEGLGEHRDQRGVEARCHYPDHMVNPPKIPVLRVGALTPVPLTDLADEARLEHASVEGHDLSGVSLAGAVVNHCAFDGVRARDTSWDAAHLDVCTVTGADFSALSATQASWQRVAWRDSRIRTAICYDSMLREVSFTGCRIDYFNMRGATLKDVSLTGCVIDELDLAGATVERLALAGSRIRSLSLHRATLTDVDLSGCEFSAINGLDALKGSAITADQLLDLAPLLAAHLGIEIISTEPDDEE